MYTFFRCQSFECGHKETPPLKVLIDHLNPRIWFKFHTYINKFVSRTIDKKKRNSVHGLNHYYTNSETTQKLIYAFIFYKYFLIHNIGELAVSILDRFRLVAVPVCNALRVWVSLRYPPQCNLRSASFTPSDDPFVCDKVSSADLQFYCEIPLI